MVPALTRLSRHPEEEAGDDPEVVQEGCWQEGRDRCSRLWDPKCGHRFATGALCEPHSDLMNWKAWGRSRESGFSEPPGHSAAR